MSASRTKAVADAGTKPRGTQAALGAGPRLSVRLRVLLIVVLTLVSSYPFLRSTIALGHDVMFHILRIESIARGLSQGIFPVRLYQAQAFGLGYPCGVCYPDTFLYPVALLRCLGLSLKGSYVTFIVAANAATAAIALFSFRRMFKSDATAALCTTLWTLAPYRLCCVMVRASVGEYLALAFAPLLALGVWATLDSTHEEHGWVWLGLACAGIVQSHVLSVVLFAVIGFPMVAVLLVRGRGQHKAVDLLRAVGLAAALSLWYVVPFLSFYTQHALKVGGVVEDCFSWTLEPAQLLAPFQTFAGVSSPIGSSLKDEMPMGIGWCLLLALPAMAIALDGADREGSDEEPRGIRYEWLVLVMLLVSVVLTTYLFPWYKQFDGGIVGRLVGKLAVIQFPWRFLGEASFLLVLLWGVLLARWQGKVANVLVAAALCLCVIEAGFATGTFVRYAPVMSEDQLLAEAGAEIGAGEYLPQEMELDDVSGRRDGLPIVSSDVVAIDEASWRNAQTYAITYRNEGAGEERISLPVIWCKLLQARVTTEDGRTEVAQLGQQGGFAELVVAPGTHATAEVRFVEPIAWRMAEAASLATLVALIVWTVRSRTSM